MLRCDVLNFRLVLIVCKSIGFHTKLQKGHFHCMKLICINTTSATSANS